MSSTTAKQEQPEHKTTQNRNGSQPALESAETPDRMADAVSFVQRARLSPIGLTPNDVLQMQRIAGNQAVGRLLGGTVQRMSEVIQRVWENTPEHAERLADNDEILIFDDRIQHIISEHGWTNGKISHSWYTFQTDDAATIKSYVEQTLASGRAYVAPGDAYDFEYTFKDVIGENSKGDTTKRMRVVVVKTGKKEIGKVQTAYPIQE